MEVTVTIPTTPSADLSPNSRQHWRTRHRAAKGLRTMAYCAARCEVSALASPVFAGSVLVATTIAWEPRRKLLDGDNALACLKAAFDGLEDAKVVLNDKQCTYLPVEQIRDPDKRGFVRVTITEV